MIRNRIAMAAAHLAVLMVASTSIAAESDDAKEVELTPEQQQQVAATEAALAELVDSAFDRYVTVADIQLAYHTLHVGRLADAALQLAHGEKILLRHHHAGIRPGDLLEVAGQIAAGKHDAKAFDRLTEAAAAIGDDSVVAALAAAKKLADQPRSFDVDLGDNNWIYSAIEDAVLLHDLEQLDSLQDVLPEDLSASQHQTVTQAIGNARQRIASASMHSALEKLTAPGRGYANYTEIKQLYASPSGVKEGGEINFSYTTNVGVLPHTFTAKIYSQYLGFGPEFDWLPVDKSFPGKYSGSVKVKSGNVNSTKNIKVIATVQVTKGNTHFHTRFRYRWVKIYP